MYVKSMQNGTPNFMVYSIAPYEKKDNNTNNNESNNQDGFEEVVKHKVRPRKNEDPDNNQFPKQKEFHKKKIHVKEEKVKN